MPGMPRIMGIVNITPDSFSDGGRYNSLSRAVDHALRLIEEGADVIDVGGESTRPGSEGVPLDEELKRVVPLVEALAGRVDCPISVDTTKPEVMRAAAAAGAGFLNDVNAFRAPGAAETAAELGLPVCVMHMLGEPRTMQHAPRYQDVVSEVRDFLVERAAVLEQAGLARENICIDPGFGFGKTLEHNLELLRRLDVLVATGYPVAVGMSRKSMIGGIIDKPVGERMAGSVAAALLAAQKGAAIVRVHDVAATRDALLVNAAVAA